jgi:hypothetical protein
VIKKIDSKYAQIKVKNIKEYLKQNESRVLNSCLSEEESFKYYYDVYSKIIGVIYELERRGFIRKQDRKNLFSLLKDGNIPEFYDKINLIGFTHVDNYSFPKKHLLMALACDIAFQKPQQIEGYYRKIVEADKFDLSSHTLLARFYQKSCKYEKAIDTLLTISSVASNSSQKINLSDNYRMLADLYMVKRDYENALANYTNSIIILDFKEKDRDKTQTLVSLGDIMRIRGNNFEAINYYKYALGMGKLKKKAYIWLLLKLSDVYYEYGNYSNGLKFSALAAKMAKKIKNDLLYSKSKYLECLNYEYLGEQEMANKSCTIAIEKAEKYKNETHDYQSYMNLAYMLDFSSHCRNPALAIQYLETASGLMENRSDIYKKVDIMEKLASLKIYGSIPETRREALKIYDELDEIYRKNNMGSGCCNNLLLGFLKEQSGAMLEAESNYFKAESELKNRRKQLATLYSYMSDFYKQQNMEKRAMLYAEKALVIELQIYRFDHHYIKHTLNKIDSIKKSQNEY